MKHFGSTLVIFLGILSLLGAIGEIGQSLKIGQTSPQSHLSQLGITLILGGFAYHSSKVRRLNWTNEHGARLIFEILEIGAILFLLFGAGQGYFWNTLYNDPVWPLTGIVTVVAWVISNFLPRTPKSENEHARAPNQRKAAQQREKIVPEVYASKAQIERGETKQMIETVAKSPDFMEKSPQNPSSPEQDKFYEIAAFEFDGPTRNLGMYTRHLVNKVGDEKLARLSYIAERVIQLSEESFTPRNELSDLTLDNWTTSMNYKGFEIYKHGNDYFRVGKNVFNSLHDVKNFIDFDKQ
jgi:hypothetical protein